MNFRRARKQSRTDVNLTPLVDVVLQLVLFFMVTAQFVVLPGLKLTLPELAPGVLAQAAERLEITLTSQSDLYFEGQATTLKHLPTLLEQTGTGGREVVILLSADAGVDYGQIIKIMDILRQTGYPRVVLAGRESEPEPPAPQFPPTEAPTGTPTGE